CVCHVSSFQQIANAANSQNYFPEWLISTYEIVDYDGYIHDLGPSQSQTSQMFGLIVHPKDVPAPQHPEYQALKSVDPGWQPSGFGATGLGQEVADAEYQSLLLLASGIQMAGPDLN